MFKKTFIWVMLSSLFLFPKLIWAVYDVDATRRITWSAGLDPVGGIPTYTSVTCSGLDPTGNTNNATQINSCITAASSGTAVYVPAGTYLIQSDINMKSNVALRGAGSTSTTLNFANGATLVFSGGASKGSNWSPGAGSGTTITSGYSQGSQSLTLSSASGYNVGDWISIFQDNDSSIMTAGDCSYCGEDDGNGDHLKQQYAQITSKNGNTIGISRPVYYVSPSASGAQVRKQIMGITMAGVENLKLSKPDGSDGSVLWYYMALYCWAKGIETYNDGASSGYPHIMLAFSHGIEVRDSWVHHGQNYNSGSNYGIAVYYWGSDHKIENNIVTDTRHSIIFSGGGAGCAVLYNYSNNNYEGDGGTLLSEDITTNHGAHPHMNLFEGNISSKLTGDYTHGSSSHNTFFRNWVTGMRNTPAYTWGVWGIDVQDYNRYYNIVGNVIGSSAWTTGTVLGNGNCSPTEPVAYRFGCTGFAGSYGDSLSYSTAIKHGNYDYVSDSVYYWDGGADHVLANSMYYASKPAFFGSLPWPAIGPDLNPMAGTTPAQQRFQGQTTQDTPSPPQNLRITP